MTVLAATTDSPVRTSFRELGLVTFGHALTHWYPATFYLLLPLIGSELGLTYMQIGSVLTSQAIASGISNVPGGILADTIGRKGLMMALSLLWIGAPYLLMGLTHEYWLLLSCAALVGMGNTLWHPTAIPLLARRYAGRRGLAVAIHGMGGNIGDAFAPLAVGAMLAVMNWRTVVMVNIVPGFIAASILLIALGRMQTNTDTVAGNKERRTRARDILRDVRLLLSNKTLLLLSTSSAFRSMTQSALLTFVPIYLSHILEYSTPSIGACMFAMQIAGFAATPIAGHLSDKLGRRRIIISSMATSAVILLFMVVAGDSAIFVFLVASLGFFLFAIRAVMQAWLLDATPPNLGGTSIGIFFGVQAMGAAIGPVTAGVLADHFGLMAAFDFVAATIVVANLFIFFTPAPRS